MRLWVVCGLALSGLVGCNFRVDKMSALQGDGRMSFAMVQRHVFGPHCMTCHNGSDPRLINLTSYSASMDKGMIVAGKPEQSQLYDSLNKARMPKGGARLPEADIQLVYQWILEGAPEFGVEPEPEIPPAPPEPTWAWISAEILQKQCTGCHNGSHPRTELDMRTYESLMSFSNLGVNAVEPGDPSSSGLFLNLKDGTMPPKGPPVEGAALDAIKDWIRAGAPKETTP